MSSSKLELKKVGDKFNIDKKLSAGCFGDVYRGTNSETDEEVAIKLESTSTDPPQLKNEADVLDSLKAASGALQPLGFQTPYFFFGVEGNPPSQYSVLVIPVLSRSLEDCVQVCKGRLSPKTTLMVADQIMMRIEYLHSKGIIHRDIKPENFMFGREEKQNIVYLTDFSLSKRYHDGKNHIPFKQGCSLIGSARYASIRTHQGHEQGRRDDLEAIGHMLMYCLRGALPWSGLEAKTKEEQYKAIKEKKESFPLEELCAGYPKCFHDYLRITREMQFDGRPNYVALRKGFTDEMEQQGMTPVEFDFDWYKGNKPPALTPLPPWVNPAQPDDPDSGTGQAAGDMKKKSCCSLM